jgi:hypothetical protein
VRVRVRGVFIQLRRTFNLEECWLLLSFGTFLLGFSMGNALGYVSGCLYLWSCLVLSGLIHDHSPK